VEEADSEWEDYLQDAIEASLGKEIPAPPAPPAQAPPAIPVDTDGDHEMGDAIENTTAPNPAPTVPPAGSASTTARTIPARSILVANGVTNREGPMTPRNDAGPFVLDGGARPGAVGASGREAS